MSGVAFNGGADNMVDALSRGSVKRFDDWVIAAQPGARTVYGCGILALTAAPPGVAERVRMLAQAGLVQLAQLPGNGGTRNYIAVRTGRALPRGFPAVVSVASTMAAGEARAVAKARRDAAVATMARQIVAESRARGAAEPSDGAA